jgi:hypothetical protein
LFRFYKLAAAATAVSSGWLFWGQLNRKQRTGSLFLAIRLSILVNLVIRFSELRHLEVKDIKLRVLEV